MYMCVCVSKPFFTHKPCTHEKKHRTHLNAYAMISLAPFLAISSLASSTGFFMSCSTPPSCLPEECLSATSRAFSAASAALTAAKRWFLQCVCMYVCMYVCVYE